MDEVYKTISRVINIDTYRKEYTYLYNYVRDTFINGLKENEHFKVLFSDLRLCGSYADNLKISKPDEFDLVMRLKFPSAELVKIVPDNSQRGNIRIYLSDVLEDLIRLKKESMYKLLRGMINENGYLLLDKFQSWLEGCFTKFLIKIGGVLSFEGNELLLSYSKQGPAHTIDVKSKSYEFSIDFVPGFQFDRNASICPRKPTEMYWEAIPRPLYGTRNNPSFRCSFTDSERKIIAQKNHFKNVLRLMKKFRDMHPKLNSLKSYYIKTLFLWHAEEVDTNFWLQQSITDIVNVMFEKLEKALHDQNLPYFWDKDLNLLSNLRQSQIVSMYYEVKNARKILIAPKRSEDILDIFLTKKEQKDMTTRDKQVIADNFQAVIKPALTVGGAVLAATAGYLIYKLFKSSQNKPPN